MALPHVIILVPTRSPTELPLYVCSKDRGACALVLARVLGAIIVASARRRRGGCTLSFYIAAADGPASAAEYRTPMVAEAEVAGDGEHSSFLHRKHRASGIPGTFGDIFTHVKT